MKQKGFAPIIIIVLIALFVAGAYISGNKDLLGKFPKISVSLPSPTPFTSPEASVELEFDNLETYTNIKYGFSFKIPKSWKYVEQEDFNIPYYGDSFYFTSCSSSPLNLSVFDLNRSDSVYKTYDQFLKDSSFSKNYLTAGAKQITVSNAPAMYHKEDGDAGSITPSVSVAIFNQKNNIIYTLYFKDACNKGFDDVVTSEFDQILSTFKFTDVEDIPQITGNELDRGWYWGLEDQKKLGTPENWVYTEAGKSSCWHKTGTSCAI